jgi:hypothetical protein
VIGASGSTPKDCQRAKRVVYEFHFKGIPECHEDLGEARTLRLKEWHESLRHEGVVAVDPVEMLGRQLGPKQNTERHEVRERPKGGSRWNTGEAGGLPGRYTVLQREQRTEQANLALGGKSSVERLE